MSFSKYFCGRDSITLTKTYIRVYIYIYTHTHVYIHTYIYTAESSIGSEFSRQARSSETAHVSFADQQTKTQLNHDADADDQEGPAPVRASHADGMIMLDTLIP